MPPYYVLNATFMAKVAVAKPPTEGRANRPAHGRHPAPTCGRQQTEKTSLERQGGAESYSDC